jgi:ribonuclease HI
MINSIEIYIDGACQPNPGAGGIGIYVKGNDIEENFSLPLNGTVTNNIAEYQALIFSLKLINKKYLKSEKIFIFSDSNLVCMHFNGQWKCKDSKLIPLLKTAEDISEEFRNKIVLSYIPREENYIADSLAKDGIKK